MHGILLSLMLLAAAPGSTLDAAIVVPKTAAADEGVLFENRWIYDHFGKFRRHFTGVISDNGRAYDQIDVELFDHSARTIYFDITAVYGATTGHTTP